MRRNEQIALSFDVPPEQDAKVVEQEPSICMPSQNHQLMLERYVHYGMGRLGEPG